MLTRAQFLASYWEFSETDVTVVEAKLAEAALEIDPTVWGVLENTGHGVLTAHLLADSPAGNGAKLAAKGDEPSTIYERRYRRLRTMASAGIRST